MADLTRRLTTFIRARVAEELQWRRDLRRVRLASTAARRNGGGVSRMTDTARIARLVDAARTGDPEAFAAFRDVCALPVYRITRAILLKQGHPATQQILDDVLTDFCCWFVTEGHAWDPTRGYGPWTWAAKRIGNIVSRNVGQYATSLDTTTGDTSPLTDRLADDTPAPVTPTNPEVTLLDTLDQLAATDPAAARLAEALHLATSTETAEDWLAFTVDGDSTALARLTGRSPEAIRQNAHRVRTRLLRHDPTLATHIAALRTAS